MVSWLPLCFVLLLRLFVGLICLCVFMIDFDCVVHAGFICDLLCYVCLCLFGFGVLEIVCFACLEFGDVNSIIICMLSLLVVDYYYAC